jgi:hypothetical protein
LSVRDVQSFIPKFRFAGTIFSFELLCCLCAEFTLDAIEFWFEPIVKLLLVSVVNLRWSA